VIGASQLVQGAGQIGLGQTTITNNGTITANQSAGMTISPNSGGFTNGKLVEATSGSTLTLLGAVTNTGGTIKALGSGSTVKLSGATVNGGTLGSSGGGLVEVTSSSTLNGIANAGTIQTDNGVVTSLQGTITNSGLLTLNASSSISDFSLIGGGTVTLAGTGTLTLSNSINNRIYGGNTTALVIGPSQLVQGAGQIGLSQTTITNNGTILANQSAGLTLAPNGGGFTNNGTLNAGAGDTLKITGPANSFTNFSGTTLTGGTYLVTGTLQFDGANIVTNAAKITLTGATSQIIDQSSANALANFATNAAGGSFALAGGRNFTTLGGFTNNGTLTVGSGSKFDVNGSLSNFSGGVLTGGTYAVAGTLQFNGANIVTNAANITLTGATSQIIDQTSANALANFADNAAAGVFSLQGGRSLTTSGSFSNEGMMTIGKSSKFKTAGAGNYTQTGGTTSVSGTLEIAGTSSTIAGTLANLSGGTVQVDKGVVTIQTTTSAFNNKGTLVVNSGATLDITGTNPFVNFASNTLTGGSYMVTGTLQFNNANIVTNAANLTLTGTASKIVDQTGITNGLANLATNASAGSLTLAGNRSLTTTGNLANSGAIKVSTGSTLTVGGTGVFTQTGTAAKTTVDGTLTASGGINISGGSVFGNNGTLAGNVTSGGTLNIGDALKKAGKESDTGSYTQSSTGVLNIDVGGLTAGTQFDQFNVTGAATLGGTLNLDLINAFTPTIGEMFDIMNFASHGTTMFSTVNGTAINSSEHFAVVYNATNVTLDVVAGLAPLALRTPHFTSTAAPSTPTGATPEPTSIVLLGSGLVGILARRWREKYAHPST